MIVDELKRSTKGGKVREFWVSAPDTILRESCLGLLV